MWDRIAPRISFLIIVLLLGACNTFEHSYASIDHVYSIHGDNYYALTLTKRTAELAWGHSGLNFIFESYGFTLPKKPEGQTKYPFRKVTLTSVYSRTKDIPEFSSGEIIVNMNTQLVSVSLKTRNGDFPGNGEYPLKYIHMPVGCPEPE
jgi:hypothetical protein